MMENWLRMVVACAQKDHAGIVQFDLNIVTGEMRASGETPGNGICLYLNQHPTQPVLYAVGSFDDEGQIRAYRLEPDYRLTLINSQPSGGYEPCYVSVGGSGRYALLVNYTSAEKVGSIRTFPIQPDGGLLPHTAHITLRGNGPHPSRQDASHPHMIIPTPDNQYVLVPDLGTDKVMIYRLDQNSGQLHPHTQPFIAIQAGSGPRHLAFHPDQRVLYVLSELEPLLTVVAYDEAGHFDVVGIYPTLPPQVATPANHHGADIHVTPSGRFLYVSNRGHNSIGIYALDPAGTALSYSGYQSTLGDWPRGFAIDPSGRMLIVANQHTNDLHTFFIDPDTGNLTPTSCSAFAFAPVCIKFLVGSFLIK